MMFAWQLITRTPMSIRSGMMSMMLPSEWKCTCMPAAVTFSNICSYTGLEELPPELRRDEEALLVAPVVGKVQALVLQRAPLLDAAQVEGKKVVAQPVDLGDPSARSIMRFSMPRSCCICSKNVIQPPRA